MNVLLVRAGALGDVLLLRPAVASLRAGGHDVSLLAPSASGSALLGPGPSQVSRLIDWERAEVSGLLADEVRVAPPLREAFRGLDLAIAYTRSEALGRGLRSALPRVVIHDPRPPDGFGHAARWLAQPVAAEGIGVVEVVPLLEPVAKDDAEAERWLAQLPPDFLVVHPGSGSPAKNWPARRFDLLAEGLSPDRPWLLVEGPAEGSSTLEGRGAVRIRSPHPSVLGAVARRAGLFVGNDSGASHLAAAWGAPTLALFGPTDPGVWSPVGPRVRVLRSPSRAMTDLPVEAVLAAARAFGAGG